MTNGNAPIANIFDDAPLHFVEVLECVRIERGILIEMVDAGLVSPAGATVEQWRFAGSDLRRLRTANRLMTDLQVNLAGAALILDLIEERDALLKRVRLLNELVEE